MPRDWLKGCLLILAALTTGFLTRPSEAEQLQMGVSESWAEALPQGGALPGGAPLGSRLPLQKKGADTSRFFLTGSLT